MPAELQNKNAIQCFSTSIRMGMGQAFIYQEAIFARITSIMVASSHCPMKFTPSSASANSGYLKAAGP